jgi:hypothetical protein
VGKVIHDTHKRWMTLDIRTPLAAQQSSQLT